VMRRAAQWVWNALSPKVVLNRQERRRSLPPPLDFGSPGGGGALRKAPKRKLDGLEVMDGTGGTGWDGR